MGAFSATVNTVANEVSPRDEEEVDARNEGIEVTPDWSLKRDPVRHPVRFLASVWEQRVKDNFGIPETPLTPKELGQLKSLRQELGDLTQPVIEWMLNPVNWWHFSQQARIESGLRHAPPQPHIGYLLAHHGIGLRVMRDHLRTSTAPADISFVEKLDTIRYEDMKKLVIVYAEGMPERLAKIEVATTLTDIQRVFIEIVDENAAAST